jgi:hypothetical protein
MDGRIDLNNEKFTVRKGQSIRNEQIENFPYQFRGYSRNSLESIPLTYFHADTVLGRLGRQKLHE